MGYNGPPLAASVRRCPLTYHIVPYDQVRICKNSLTIVRCGSVPYDLGAQVFSHLLVREAGTMLGVMPRKSDSKRGANSRANTVYVGISREQYELLEQLAKADDRSVSWMARKAIREFLDRNS